MKYRRWIIRLPFILLFVLSLGGWGLSHLKPFHILVTTEVDRVTVIFVNGGIVNIYTHLDPGWPKQWLAMWDPPMNNETLIPPPRPFDYRGGRGTSRFYLVRLWFLSALSALYLCGIWWVTRRRKITSGVNFELKKTLTEQNGPL